MSLCLVLQLRISTREFPEDVVQGHGEFTQIQKYLQIVHVAFKKVEKIPQESGFIY